MMGGVGPADGLVHGSDSSDAVACIDRLRHELLVFGLDAAVVFDAVRHDPDFAAGHALGAAMHLLAMSAEGQANARPMAATAVALAGRAPPRERLLVAAISCWTAGDTHGCERRLAALLAHWPQDLVAARLLQVHQLNRGDFAAMLRTTGGLLAANPHVSHVLGMHAFALAETGHLEAAEQAGRHAADAAFDPWSEHAVAHVLSARGEHRAALDWLTPRASRWSACSSFLYTHNWWHVALAHLGCGEPDAALALFDARVWGVRKHYCQDQLNAVALLARLELAGVDVADRWVDMASWLAPRTSEHVNGLLDLHYLYGLARAGRDAEVRAMQASLADKARATRRGVWRTIVPVAADGLVAHARQQWRLAAERLGAVLPQLFQVGGSSVQRDLFHRLVAHARQAST